ncbi:hypothetical protein TNCV_935731 [Trichonephila clavipes]|nr:hypothetical protein TNCV_935731 [Trichonephila clavipes]
MFSEESRFQLYLNDYRRRVWSSQGSLPILLFTAALPHGSSTSSDGLCSRSPIVFGLLQGEWTHGPDLALLISRM